MDFEKFYKEKKAIIISSYLRSNISRIDAEEIANDAFVSFFTNYSDANEDDAIKLLHRIAKNKLIDFIRDKRNQFNHALYHYEFYLEAEELTFQLKSYEKTPEDTLLIKERSEKIRELAKTLDPKIRGPFEEYYINDLMLHEIAEKLDMNLNTVKSYVYRGLRFLKEEIKVIA